MNSVEMVVANIISNLSDPKWWSDEFASWLFFSLFAGFAASATSQKLEVRRNRPFEGWVLKLVHVDGTTQSEPVYIEDVKRCLSSSFELFKMVKSTLNSYGYWVEVPVGESAFHPAGEQPAWVRTENQSFVIDLPQAIVRRHVSVQKERRVP
jgi:hypothetical protein